MSKIYIKEEELEQIRSTIGSKEAHIVELGIIEIEKLNLKQRRLDVEDLLKVLAEELKTLSEWLESQYGKSTIDIDTGEVTPL